MNKLAKLEALDPEIVVDYLDTGKSSAIAPDLQHYIFQIQWAIELWQGERNTVRLAKKLQERILATQGIKLSVSSCRGRLYDALNYFDVDCNIPQEIWDRDSANKFEDLAKLAISQDKLDVAQRCYKLANECRARANSAIDPAALQPPMFLITPKISPEDLGFKTEKQLAITQKANEGYYAKLISELPVEATDKKRLLSDAGIEDVEFEEIEDEEPR